MTSATTAATPVKPGILPSVDSVSVASVSASKSLLFSASESLSGVFDSDVSDSDWSDESVSLVGVESSVWLSLTANHEKPGVVARYWSASTWLVSIAVQAPS
jgi:hypothetical protein